MAKSAKDEFDYEDYGDYSEEVKLQLLPPKEASNSVARFHKDPEQPSLDSSSTSSMDEKGSGPSQPDSPQSSLPSAFLRPPLPVSPVQFVGQVMTPRQLKSLPHSPIVRIAKTKSKKERNRSGGGGRIRTIPLPEVEEDEEEEDEPTAGLSVAKGRSNSLSKEEEDVQIGLPVQLRSPGRGLPPPLVWISPASLARSPMVSLRRMRNELSSADDDLPLERALTMSFPARRRKIFQPECVRCLAERKRFSKCPECAARVR